MDDVNQKIVGIRFSKGSKIYDFSASISESISLHDFVIVDTSRGKQIGEIVKIYENMESHSEREGLKSVERLATAGELVSHESWNLQSDEIMEYAQRRAKELHLKDIRLLNAEYNFDGTYLLLTYSSCNEEKIDLKSLRYDVQKMFNIQNVEMKQLGPRDVAKAIGGMGACGIACRCCTAHLTEFNSISIKMAKEQGISLTPTEITGMCGRLRCCLEYENEYYVECRKQLPRKKKKVMTPQGEGKVLEVFPLRKAVLVDIPEVGRREFRRDQITFDEPKETAPEGTETKKESGETNG